MVEYGLLEMGFASFFFFLRKFTPQKSTKGSKMLIDGEEGNDFIVSPRIFSWVADPTCRGRSSGSVGTFSWETLPAEAADSESFSWFKNQTN